MFSWSIFCHTSVVGEHIVRPRKEENEERRIRRLALRKMVVGKRKAGFLKHGYDIFVVSHRHHPLNFCSMVFTSFSLPVCSAGAMCGLAATRPPPRLA
jgi:hypothetical protein